MTPHPTADRLRRSGNVVFLPARTPSTIATAAAPRQETQRGLADAIVAGGLLTGLAFAAQNLAVALIAA